MLPILNLDTDALYFSSPAAEYSPHCPGPHPPSHHLSLRMAVFVYWCTRVTQLREEQLFIDTMLTINTEAFRLQQQEGADIG